MYAFIQFPCCSLNRSHTFIHNLRDEGGRCREKGDNVQVTFCAIGITISNNRAHIKGKGKGAGFKS